MNPRFTEEARRKIVAHYGLDPDVYDYDPDGPAWIVKAPKQDIPEPKGPSTFGSVLRGAAASALPTAAGAAAAIRVANLIPHPIAKVVGALGTAIAAGAGTSAAQNALLPESITSKIFPSQQDIEENPIATSIGGIAGALPTFKFSPKDLKALGSATRKGLAKLTAGSGPGLGSLSAAERNAVINSAIQAGIGGGLSAAEDVRVGRDIHPGKALLEAAGNVLLNAPTRLGRALGLPADVATPRGFEDLKGVGLEDLPTGQKLLREAPRQLKAGEPTRDDQALLESISNLEQNSPQARFGRSPVIPIHKERKLLKAAEPIPHPTEREFSPEASLPREGKGYGDFQKKLLEVQKQFPIRGQDIRFQAGEESLGDAPLNPRAEQDLDRVRRELLEEINARGISVKDPRFLEDAVNLANKFGIKVVFDALLSEGQHGKAGRLIKTVLGDYIAGLGRKASADTGAHEVLHGVLLQMRDSKSPGAQAYYKKIIALTEASPEYLQAKAQAPSMDAEEFLTLRGGYDYIRRLVKVGSGNPLTELWRDLKAIYKTRINKASSTDLARVLSGYLTFEAPVGERLTSGFIVGPRGFEPINVEELRQRRVERETSAEAAKVKAATPEGAAEKDAAYWRNKEELAGERVKDVAKPPKLSPEQKKAERVLADQDEDILGKMLARFDRDGKLRTPEEEIRSVASALRSRKVKGDIQKRARDIMLELYRRARIDPVEGVPLGKITTRNNPLPNKVDEKLASNVAKRLGPHRRMVKASELAREEYYKFKGQPIPSKDAREARTPAEDLVRTRILHIAERAMSMHRQVEGDVRYQDPEMSLSGDSPEPITERYIESALIQADEIDRRIYELEDEVKVLKEQLKTMTTKELATSDILLKTENIQEEQKKLMKISNALKWDAHAVEQGYFPEEARNQMPDYSLGNDTIEIRYADVDKAVTQGAETVAVPGTRARYAFARIMESSIDSVRREDAEVADAAEKFFAQASLNYGVYENAPLERLARLGATDKEMSKAYDNYLAKKGKEGLSKKERSVYDLVDETFGHLYREKQRALGLPMYDLNLEEMTPPDFFNPQIFKDDILNAFIEDPQGSIARDAKTAWVNHIRNNVVITEAKAKDYVNEYVAAIGNREPNSIEFAALRRMESISIPNSIAELDLMKAMRKAGRRVSQDFAFHQHLQSNPSVASKLDLPSPTGRGRIRTEGSPPMPGRAVANLKKHIFNDFVAHNPPRITAAARAVSNAILGAPTGVRDAAQAFTLALPYFKASELATIMPKAFSNFRQGWKASLEYGARSGRMDSYRWRTHDSPDKVVKFFNSTADFFRKYQGRDLIEQSTRAFMFAVGQEGTKLRIVQALNGSEKAKAWLKQFGTLVEDLTPEKLLGNEVAINTISANFVSRHQGTYDARGLPSSAFEGQLAPFLALSRWSIERANILYKDVITPALEGKDYRPLIAYTMGAYVTGAVIEKLNELMSGKRSSAATLKEAIAAENPQYIIASVIALGQLGSYMGIVGDTARVASDVLLTGDPPRGLSFPLVSFVTDDLTQTAQDYSEAIRDGENPLTLLPQAMYQIMRSGIQNLRMADNHLQAVETERKNKFRDRRIFDKLSGERTAPLGSLRTNELVGQDKREFKRSSDVQEASTMINGLVKDAIERANGDPYKLKRELTGLRNNNYQTLPDPKNFPLSFIQMITFLEKTQGKDAAEARLKDYIKQKAINHAKSQLVPRG